MSALTETPRETGPTADRPEYGEILLRESIISRVAYWREGDLHVFRSLEYDVIAADENRDQAARIFVDKSEDYARFLLDPDGEPTRDDLKLASTIYTRLLEGYHKPVSLARLALVRLLRGRGHDAARGWYHRSAALT